MGVSYKEASEIYKNAKRIPIEDEEIRYRKKKKHPKRGKKTDHKHQYAPAVFEQAQAFAPFSLGEYCTICGKVHERRLFPTKEMVDEAIEDGAKVIKIDSDDLFIKYVTV